MYLVPKVVIQQAFTEHQQCSCFFTKVWDSRMGETLGAQGNNISVSTTPTIMISRRICSSRKVKYTPINVLVQDIYIRVVRAVQIEISTETQGRVRSHKLKYLELNTECAVCRWKTHSNSATPVFCVSHFKATVK